MAKGLYLTSDGQVLVEYDKRRRVPIPSAQYKANGYKPPCDKLPAEVPREARTGLAHAEARGPIAHRRPTCAAIETPQVAHLVGRRHSR
jgi:hypothetical protein